MKIYTSILLIILFPVMSLGSNSQGYSNSVPYIGISSTAASISAYSLVKYFIPDKKARQAAPYTYLAGKGLLACGALTSGVSSACGFKKVAQATDTQINSQYFDILGVALPVGYLFSVAGECLVNRAHMIAHDDELKRRVTSDVRASLLQPSWVDSNQA
jgi:hypothetical protein